MEPLIRPEPSEDERRAILAALAGADPRRPAVYDSRWRAAALEEGVADSAPGGPDEGVLAD